MKIVVIALLLLLLVGCQPQTAVSSLPSAATTATAITTPATTPLPLPTATDPATPTAVPLPATITAVPTQLPSATPTATVTPTASPSPTPIASCTRRVPQDDLLTIVTQQYGLSRDYAPRDLVLLNDYFPFAVTKGYPNQLRQVAIEPLVTMISAMQEASLQPQIISGYRSYAQQEVAYRKWLEKEPERATILSARPGYSEHQLGTAVDFGSPELPGIVGVPDIEFHTYFYQTSEGVWLAENAHHYGFTLSYPRDASEITGFFYEPWHFRYVGVELAKLLHENNQSLTAYQLANLALPCLPEE
jgi:LAS superfamily LD-carboxypeptidase LdcB